MIPNVGPLEIGIILVVVLFVFGAKRLPELGSSLGKGIRGFGSGLKGDDDAGPALEAGAEAAQPEQAGSIRAPSGTGDAPE